jgi:hypothetical protein
MKSVEVEEWLVIVRGENCRRYSWNVLCNARVCTGGGYRQAQSEADGENGSMSESTPARIHTPQSQDV